MDSQHKKAITCNFTRDYELGRIAVISKLMRNVIGCDYDGTSWTTREEAVQLAELLELHPGRRLLDVGAGAGWPGLFFAQLSGCDLELVDIPIIGLQWAIERASADGLQQRCRVVGADGAALPFKGGSFHALSHSDVLCCTPEKLAMLTECRRVACANAKMVFSVIAPAPDLSESERETAVIYGPPFVDVPDDYAILLRQSGWRILKRIDVTTEYLDSNRILLAEMRAHLEELAEVFDSEELSERLGNREGAITAIEDGLLQRHVFIAITD